MFTRIRLVAHLDKYMSGGSILHININESDVSTDTLIDLAKAMYKQGVVYFAFNRFKFVTLSLFKPLLIKIF